MDRDDELTHLDREGQARMVDVGTKDKTSREAKARATLRMKPETRRVLLSGNVPKGDALAAARIAGIQASKRTSELIPLCHPLPLTSVDVAVDRVDGGAQVTVTAATTAQTGVEMEAMTAAAIGAVTIYDMVKGVERGVEIGPVRLLRKSGGKSGEWHR